MTRCPCCGAETAALIVVDPFGRSINYGGRSEHLGPKQLVIAQALVSAMPGFVARRDLELSIWGDNPGAVVDDPKHQLGMLLHGIRAAFGRLGISVVNDRGVGWRLVPAEQATGELT